MIISIIIPVYNAEKYLDRCLKSVLAALTNFGGAGEIVLVDNNSTDSSQMIEWHYQKEHRGMITVLRCNTPGAAAARNMGARETAGKYIWFVDADDEIAPDSITKLVGMAERTGADLVMMGAKRIMANDKTDYLSAVSPGEENYKSRFVRYGLGPWQVLIRREWWVAHGFSFREGIIQEDMELMSALILYTDNFMSVDEPLYLYYQNEDSVLHPKEYNPHIFDIFPALEGLYSRFESAGVAERYHDELEWFFIWNLLIDSAKDFRAFPEGKPGIKQSRQMLKKYFPKWRRNKFLKEKPLRLRTRVKMNYRG